MRHKLLMMGVTIATCVSFAACGGGGGGTGGTGEESGGGTGVASVDSLNSIPSVDLSQYDSSQSSTGNLATRGVKSASVSKAFGENIGAVGGTSRAGCEQNMQKQEVFRMSQMAQMERCYPEAMERIGLIGAIPSGSYAYYRIAPPEMAADQQTGMCDDIPAERTEERAACEADASGGPKTILLRLGKIDDALHIDMCEGDPASHINSATYSASGSLYTAAVVRIGEFGGKTESGSFSMSVDIGTSGTITNGVVTIGDSGFVTAAGQMNGGFGSGNINFERATDSSIKISGAFSGGFDDPFSGTRSEFTGKTYSRVGGSPVTGCAKFSFTGTMPAMPVADMIPFNIGADQLASFLQTFGAQLGIDINASNYLTMKLCPNPNFDPNNFDPTIKPMVKLEEGATSCGSVTHSDTECFSITNATTTTDFGSQVTQAFTIIADSASSFFAEVSGFDLSTLSPTIGTIAFAREWDCSGTFSDVDFTSVAPETIMAEMQTCRAIEEKARNNGGMGNEGQCGKGEQMDGVNQLAEGGGGQTTFGGFGGEYSKVSNGTCPAQTALPEKLFANSIDDDTFCLPMDGRCEEFNVVNNNASPLNIAVGGGATITALGYNANPATSVQITFLIGQASCTASYSVMRPEFTSASGGFGGEGGGDQPGEGGYIPRPCAEAGLTGPEDGDACHQLCNQPGVDCRS